MKDIQILIIDDEESWIISMRMLISRKFGIREVTSCTDSRKAVGIIDQQPISFVLLDYSMPHLDGMRLLQVIKEKKPNIPVIMLSGRNQDEMALMEEHHEADGYVNKSAGTEDILREIKRLFGIHY